MDTFPVDSLMLHAVECPITANMHKSQLSIIFGSCPHDHPLHPHMYSLAERTLVHVSLMCVPQAAAATLKHGA